MEKKHTPFCFYLPTPHKTTFLPQAAVGESASDFAAQSVKHTIVKYNSIRLNRYQESYEVPFMVYATKLYKNNLETYVKGQDMTWKTKIKVMITVTLLMTIDFVMMFSKAIYIPCII